MTKPLTFITGNQNKADHLAKHLGTEIAHHKVDLDEIQSTDLHAIVEHKVKQAYEILKTPVLVEDVSLEFTALGHLPGPFIKFFVENSGLEACCRMLDGFDDRSAIGRCTFGYYDGDQVRFFDGELPGKIALNPRGNNGFGWDKIFIPDGYTTTRAELDSQQYGVVYATIKPFGKLKDFLNE